MSVRLAGRWLLAGALLASASVAVGQAAPGPRYGSFGVDLTARDPAVKPGDDFWTFANGGWDKATPIAADRITAGVGVQLVDEAEVQVRAILDEATKNPAALGPSGRQLRDLYGSYMDEAAIERAGTAPLRPYFATIDAARDRAALQRLFATPGYASPVGFQQLPDPADPTRWAVGSGQGQLGLGARDLYLLPGEKYDRIRTAYRAYVERMLTLAGLPDASARADRIVALETAMAKVFWTPVQQRDLMAMIRPMDAAGRAKLAPEFDWELMLRTAGYQAYPTVIMSTSTALTEIAKIFAATPVETWQDWLKFNLVSGNAQFLPKAFDDARFEMYGRTLAGQQEQRARWKRGVALANATLGEAVGQIYVQRHYPPESERKMAELIADLRAAYGQRIAASDWMDAPTREKALAKLATFDPRIGHPQTYIDYTKMDLKPGDPLGNAMRAQQFAHELELSRLGKPVDRTLWAMTPQTVNAYYNPLLNQITFPAAILQPPMFDPRADAAVNYGAVGAVIGHEMGHGFDDQGSQFGATGKFENWWTPAAREAFKARGAQLSAQFDQYEPIPGLRIKGALTLGENIGDLGGLEAAYAAFQNYQKRNGPSPVIDGLTADQRFFLAYAQTWRSKLREDTLRTRLLTDPHSPAYYRVNGIVRNVDAWYEAFGVKPGDKMYLPPEQRVKIW